MKAIKSVSRIGSTRNYGVVLKLERFFHPIGWSFGLGSHIELGYLSLLPNFLHISSVMSCLYI